MALSMAKIVDRGASVLLLLGAGLHSVGVRKFYAANFPAMLWAEIASFAILLLVGINWLRSMRPGDTALAVLSAFAAGGWLVIAAVCSQTLLNGWGDPRFILNALPSAVLLGFSLNAIRR